MLAAVCLFVGPHGAPHLCAAAGRPDSVGPTPLCSSPLRPWPPIACAVLCCAAPRLRGLDAVAPLVKVAYDGKGDTASKNAAIALARMAHDPAMLERLRELHGIEIIYQYVKP